jgi:demethylmenaquinone methyltransferase / 2-methoxy-6-polyprenyl-1,4-benzoquinol methylase
MYYGWEPEPPPPPSDYGSGEMFNAIADRYDVINRIMSLGMDTQWRQRMVQTVHASLQPHTQDDDTSSSPLRILDVSTGTADVALLLAKEMPRASILGIDPSDKMLEIGRTKVHQQGLDARIVLEQHDARDLTRLRVPERASLFDAATMAFGIRNVPEKDVALCEIHRLLKDASRFCILEFAEPDPESSGVLGALARVFIRHVVPFVGGILVSSSIQKKKRSLWSFLHFLSACLFMIFLATFFLCSLLARSDLDLTTLLCTFFTQK